MFGIDFQALSLWANLGIFAVAAGVVWVVGTQVSRGADALTKRTALGSGFVGLVLLGVITDSPEIGTTATAAAIGDAPLALNNIFGGVVVQTAILAFADLILIRGALTYFTPRPTLLLQGSMLILLLASMLTAAAVGEPIHLLGVGLGTAVLFGVYILSLYLVGLLERRDRTIFRLGHDSAVVMVLFIVGLYSQYTLR